MKQKTITVDNDGGDREYEVNNSQTALTRSSDFLGRTSARQSHKRGCEYMAKAYSMPNFRANQYIKYDGLDMIAQKIRGSHSRT